MFQLTVTIGRNIDNAPMSAYHWHTFTRSVHLAMTRDLSHVEGAVEIHNGRGNWAGIEEESRKISRLRQEPWSEGDIAVLRSDLQRIAQLYKQDAIALTVCESFLVTPRVHKETAPYVHTGFEAGAL